MNDDALWWPGGVPVLATVPIDPDAFARLLDPLPAPPRRAARSPQATTASPPSPPSGEPPVRLDAAGMARWRGEVIEATADGGGQTDRSKSLFLLGAALWRAGATAPTIVAALAERDAALGWHKYTGRADAEVRYRQIADTFADDDDDTGADADDDVTRLRRENADLRRQLAELRALHSAVVQADHAPHLGPERTTATALVAELATVPVGEWKPMPHARLGAQAGVSPRAIPRHLAKLTPAIGGAVEVATRWVAETADAETGEIRPGHRETVARLKTDHLTALRVIAQAVPTNGHKNGHGGKRPVCPACGDVGIDRTVTDRCARCGTVLQETKTRVKPGNCHLDMIGCAPADDGADTVVAPTTPTAEAPTADPGGTHSGPSKLPVHVLNTSKVATHHNVEADGGAEQPLLVRPLTDRVRRPPPGGVPPPGSIAAAWQQGQSVRAPGARTRTADSPSGEAGDDRWTS